MTVTVEEFTGDPFAPASAQLALRGSTFAGLHDDHPSPVGVRPWGLLRARPVKPVTSPRSWRYDPNRQIAVDPESGEPLSAGDPSADTTTSTDGEDPPSAEDWDND